MSGIDKKTLIASVLIAAAVAGATGYATASLTHSVPASQNRTVYLFTTVLGFNETLAKQAFGFDIPHDYFAPDRITVNRGDNVTIRYYNTEDSPEDHTFTMSAPYALDYLLHFQEHKDIVIRADTPGVFTYVCTKHPPTMTGSFVVLG